MNNNFLISRPNYDNTTFYLFKWSEKCLQIADERGIEYTDFWKFIESFLTTTSKQELNLLFLLQS